MNADSASVLVVEDEMLVRDMIAQELEDEGFAVTQASTGDQAFMLLQQKPFALLLTDIRLPGKLDGWTLAEQAKKLYPSLQVLYVTGYSPGEARLAPESRLILKPYKLSEVVAAAKEMTTSS